MLDNVGRIGIQPEFGEFPTGHREVHIYFSQKENLYFILPWEDKNEFFVYLRNLDEKRRFYLPKDILKEYGTQRVILAKKKGLIYILPFAFPEKEG